MIEGIIFIIIGLWMMRTSRDLEKIKNKQK